MGTISSAIVSVVVGGAIAVASIAGVIKSQTSTPDESPVNVSEVGISYGAN